MLHENKEFKKPKLLHLDLELSSLCNFNCKVCPRPNDEGTMSFYRIYEIIHSFAIMGGETIKPFWRGEPTFYSRLPQVLQYAKECGLKTMLNTNGSFPQHNAIEIVSHLDWISFSIDYTHGNIENIHKAVAIKQLAPPDLHIEVQSLERSSSVEEYCKKFDIPYKVDEPTKRAADDDKSKVMQGQRKYCKFPDWRLIVAYNGDVTICCVDWKLENTIGNVFITPLKEIWEGPRMCEIRQELKSGVYTSLICQNCPSRSAYV